MARPRADGFKSSEYREKTINLLFIIIMLTYVLITFRTAKLHEDKVRSKLSQKCLAVRSGEKVLPRVFTRGGTFSKYERSE